MVRRRGTRLSGWTASTRRTAHSHQPTATAMPSVGSGSNDQPNRRIDGVGGSRDRSMSSGHRGQAPLIAATAVSAAATRWIQ